MPATILCGALLGVAGYLGFAGRGHWFDLGTQSAHAFMVGGRPERGDETVRSLYKDRLQVQRYAGLEPAVMAYEWRRLNTLQTELRALEPTHQELRLAVLSAAQLHELQHRLD